MILKCNVCKEGSVKDIASSPAHINDIVCCDNCGKLMAYVSHGYTGKILRFRPVDTAFDKEKGITPVEILTHQDQ